MSYDPSDNDLIERYLLGKMTEAEGHDFLVRVENDREFARKFRLFKTFPEMMSEKARLEYEKNRAEAATPKVKKKSSRLVKPRYLIWAVILCILLIGIALIFIFIRQDHKTENVVPKQNVIRKSEVNKSEIAPVKDTPLVVSQKQQPERKEIKEATVRTTQKPIELINPAEGMKFSRKEMILFVWKQRTDTFTRFYIISEFRDQVVFWRGIRPGVREYQVPGGSLYPGKYYWYVGSKEEKRTFTISE